MVNRLLQAGVALAEISPNQGIALAGYPHHPRHNQGVHDPLYAACLCLDDGETRIAVITMDLLMCAKKYVRSVREGIAAKTGIPAVNIMICCSHTHSGPWASGMLDLEALEKGDKPDGEFVAVLQDKLVCLAAEAAKNLFPARIGVDKGYCGREQGVGGNRRDPMGIVDPEVWALGIQDLQGNWRAALVKYALHPTFLHSDSNLVSADYPGYIRKYFQAVKPGMTFLFAQGTSGNQSPRYFRSGKTFAEAERVGTAIGREADRVLNKMTLSSQVSLLAKSTEVDLDVRQLPAKAEAEAQAGELRRTWEEVLSPGASEGEVWNAELRFLGAEATLGYVRLEEQGKELELLAEETPVEVQVIGIGEVRMVGLQGEIFVEFGITIQYRSPFEKTFVIELANGCLPGYAATAQAYVQGGYETGASMLTGRSGEQLVEAAVQLLYETRTEGVSQ